VETVNYFKVQIRGIKTATSARTGDLKKPTFSF